MRQIKGFVESVKEGAQNKTIKFAGGLTTSDKKFEYELVLDDNAMRELLSHHVVPKKAFLTYDNKKGILMLGDTNKSGHEGLMMGEYALKDMASTLTPKKKGPGAKDRDLLKELQTRMKNTSVVITIGTPKKSSGFPIDYNALLKNVEIGLIFQNL
jgi:hypothetical protein